MIGSVARFNQNNESIVKFRKEFINYQSEKAYYICINGEFSYVLPKSEISCCVMKPNGKENIFDEYNIDDINSDAYTITDADDCIHYAMIFDINAIKQYAERLDSLFVLSAYISKKRTIYRLEKYSNKEITLVSSNGDEYVLTTDTIVNCMFNHFKNGLEKDKRKGFYTSVPNDSHKELNATCFRIILNPIIPVNPISRNEIIETRNDLIPRKCMDLKQVYRYEGELYFLKLITDESVIFKKVFDAVGFDVLTVSHSDATKFDPISGVIGEQKELRQAETSVFKDYESPVVIERKDHETMYLSSIRHSLMMCDILPDDVKNVYSISNDKMFKIPDDSDFVRDIVNNVRKSYELKLYTS